MCTAQDYIITHIPPYGIGKLNRNDSQSQSHFQYAYENQNLVNYANEYTKS